VQFDNLFDQGQANPGTFKFITGGKSLEELENFGKMLGFDARAVIGDTKLPKVSLLNLFVPGVYP
jgi:hypothetical protein